VIQLLQLIATGRADFTGEAVSIVYSTANAGVKRLTMDGLVEFLKAAMFVASSSSVEEEGGEGAEHAPGIPVSRIVSFTSSVKVIRDLAMVVSDLRSEASIVALTDGVRLGDDGCQAVLVGLQAELEQWRADMAASRRAFPRLGFYAQAQLRQLADAVNQAASGGVVDSSPSAACLRGLLLYGGLDASNADVVRLVRAHLKAPADLTVAGVRRLGTLLTSVEQSLPSLLLPAVPVVGGARSVDVQSSAWSECAVNRVHAVLSAVFGARAAPHTSQVLRCSVRTTSQDLLLFLERVLAFPQAAFVLVAPWKLRAAKAGKTWAQLCDFLSGPGTADGASTSGCKRRAAESCQLFVTVNRDCGDLRRLCDGDATEDLAAKYFKLMRDAREEKLKRAPGAVLRPVCFEASRFSGVTVSSFCGGSGVGKSHTILGIKAQHVTQGREVYCVRVCEPFSVDCVVDSLTSGGRGAAAGAGAGPGLGAGAGAAAAGAAAAADVADASAGVAIAEDASPPHLTFSEAVGSHRPVTLVLFVSVYAPFPALDAFLFDLCVLGAATSRATGRVLALPCNANLHVLIEVPHPIGGILKHRPQAEGAELAAASAAAEAFKEARRGDSWQRAPHERAGLGLHAPPCPCEWCVAAVPGFHPRLGCSHLLTTLSSIVVEEHVIDDAAPFVMPRRFQLAFRVLRAYVPGLLGWLGSSAAVWLGGRVGQEGTRLLVAVSNQNHRLMS
jgi:hypothetical protein